MGRNKEYALAIRIAGEIDKSFPKSMQLSKAELRAIAKEAARTQRELSNTSRQMGKGLFDSSALKETQGMFTAIEKAGVKAFKTIGKASVAAGAAVGVFSVKTGMDYEKQMSTVKAISKANDSDFKIMQEEAKRIGATTAATAKEAGQAMEYEAMAGWKADQIVAATSAIVDLKQSSDDLDLATTSDILTDAITAFDMKAKDATHMADVMAAASTNANTDVAMLGESFKYAAPMAGSMGYSVEDAALTLGLMANSGIKSSMAGTTERNWIKRMVKPTKESEAAMKELGLSTKDEKGKSKSLLEITEDTRRAFKKIKDKDERSKYAAMLAGSQGMNGLLAITKASEKDFQKLKKAIYDCDGAAKELAETRLDNLEGDVTLFSSAMQGAGIEIYEEIKEPLRDLVQGATEWVGDFSKGFETTFPTVVREVKQAGEAIGDFAEPFLEVGKWMLDNPDVIAGTIAGIGAAIGTHKVIEGVNGFESALRGLTRVSIPTLAITGAAAVIGGAVTAMTVSGKQAKETSLDRHFGDVALSMDEVQQTAKEIVGAKKLKQVGELFQSMESVENVAKAMESAKKEFSTIEWKVSAGFKLSDSDMDSFENSVKQYVAQSQELISEKGYEVNIATKVLFGNSKEGKNLVKDNNKFFSDLDKEAKGLSNEINKKLEKAMEDGLNPDLEKEINGLLEQLSDITNRVSEAEEQTSWQMLESEWSGKELNSDSFKNVIKEAEANADELKEGAKEAKESMLIPLNDKRNQGKISKKEYDAEYKRIDEAYQKRVNKADERVSDFLYNTIMDTYGTKIADGPDKMQTDDLNGLMEIINVAKETGPLTGKLGQLANSMDAIEQRTDTGFHEFSFDNIAKNVLNLDGLAIIQDGGTDVLKESWSSASGLAQEYINENPMDFEEYLNKPAQDASMKACEDIKNIMDFFAKEGLGLPLFISMKDSFSAGAGVISTKKKKGENKSTPNKKMGPGAFKVKPYAQGGIATEPMILVAEAGKKESVIPLDGSSRSIDLWNQTGRLLGVENDQKRAKPFSEILAELSGLQDKESNRSGGNRADGPVYITYSPNITIQGNADEAVVKKATAFGYDQFVKFARQYDKTQRRTSLKGGK